MLTRRSQLCIIESRLRANTFIPLLYLTFDNCYVNIIVYYRMRMILGCSSYPQQVRNDPRHTGPYPLQVLLLLLVSFM